ncbi:hypothetical protein C8R44DRAFT_877194 [Mycena epipterygia]|nr:hypothetical protein C8R44DRAFT_877194 [Mycena epipterygia]
MHNPTVTSTTASTPTEEMDALIVQVADLSKLALKMTQHCIDLHDNIPRVVVIQVAAKVAAELAALADTAAAPTTADNPASDEFVELPAPTPDELDALFPIGTGDSQVWHVVCIGREPGLYANHMDAYDQITGVPNSFRMKKSSLCEALNFYRWRYARQEVKKLVESPGPAPQI